ncbi:MAG: enoyl-CoA hydratase/isomerase family protein, partial [Acidimicrobiia bacterium]|nr:enoyl-CoA hydratase/isomerase family protein [Acidimicrobiia bacterium]
MTDGAPVSADPAPIEVDTSTAGVGLIRLNRPERLNAITVGLARELRASLIELPQDPGCRAIVLTGNGRAFCAGADQELVTSPRDPADPSTRGGISHEVLDVFLDVIRAVRAAPVPVIAAVNGAAVGAGMALAVAADIRVAARAASFHVGTIRVGLTGGEAGLSWLLPRIMGMSRAMELLVTGRPLDALEAAAGGLVSRVAED